MRETLRLHSPASGVLRRLTEPLSATGHRLPAGVTTMVPIGLVQRDPRGYRDPEEFRPQRWLSDSAPATRFHFPFGGGVRRCVGEPLAHAEIETAIPAILRTIHPRPVAGEPERAVLRGTVMVPRRGVVVQASRR